jgi:hypothetical protein
MKEQEMALRNTVLRTVTGSHLYGTNTPESDHDEAGIFVPDQDYVIGTKRCEQVEVKSNSSDSGKRNGPEDSDVVLYSLPKFIHLASGCNPNIIELLFSSSYLILSPVGETLVAERHLFLSQLVRKTFVGYAKAQMAKLTTKKDRLDAINKTRNRVTDLIDSAPDERLFYEGLPWPIEVKGQSSVYKVYEKGRDVLEVRDDLSHLEDEYGLRTKSVEQFGYDTKFAMHIFRLLWEALILLETGKLAFPFTGSTLNFLMDVRSGKMDMDKILKTSTDMIAAVDACKSKLPEQADVNAICELQVDLLRRYWKYPMGGSK